MRRSFIKTALLGGAVAGAFTAAWGAFAIVTPIVVKLYESGPLPFPSRDEVAALEVKVNEQAQTIQSLSKQNATTAIFMDNALLGTLMNRLRDDQADLAKNPHSAAARRDVCDDINQANPVRLRNGEKKLPVPDYCD